MFRVEAQADGGLNYLIIGDDRARGVCGSGLVDLIARLIEVGRLTPVGRFVNGATGFAFSTGGTDLTLSKNDVDLMQRAKAAIGVGIRVLCSRAGVSVKELRRVCVAGAFGRYLDIASAQSIGLLPMVPPEKVELAGNTALAGCCDVMLSSLAAGRLDHLRSIARLLNLAQQPGFEELFMENLYLQPLRED